VRFELSGNRLAFPSDSRKSSASACGPGESDSSRSMLKPRPHSQDSHVVKVNLTSVRREKLAGVNEMISNTVGLHDVWENHNRPIS
jgi:hypothetical protein